MRTLHDWQHRPDWKIGANMGSKSNNSAANRGIAYHQRVYRLLLAKLKHEADLLIEPWFERIDDQPRRTMRQPDAIIRYLPESAIVVEVKLNWRDGRDDKLLNEYLPIVRNALKLDVVWPLLITRNLRGYDAAKPLLGLGAIDDCLAWEPGLPTPVLLLP